MDEAGYELSASYMKGLVASVKSAGMLEGILAGLPSDLRSAYLRPPMQPWWDAHFAEQLVVAVDSQFGERAVEEVGYGVVVDAMGPIASPQVQAMILGGATTATFFSQMEQFIALAVRPVTAHWTQQGDGKGLLEIKYPQPVKKQIPVLWRGAIRYVLEITGAKGKIEREQQPAPGHLTYEVSWSKAA
jgi:hypothetical protein